MSIRKDTEGDSLSLDSLLGTKRGADDPNTHTHVLEDADVVVGAVLWLAPTGGPAMLGTVALADGRSQKDMYWLILATAEDALARGYKRAVFTLKRAALVTTIHQDFEATITEVGWNPSTKKAVEWGCEVDLVDAIAQLKAVLRG